MLVKNPERSADEALTAVEPEHPLAPCISPAIRAIESLMADLAAAGLPVLLLGETGTGKEVVAASIHRLSDRREGPFVKLRCSGLTPDDLDRCDRGGSDGGSAEKRTVFLDEIYDLTPVCQARLLEKFSGSNGEPEKFDIGACVISSSCHDIEAAMRNGRLRDDLYYRLNGVCLRLPPLRERREDILPLANFFLDRYSAAYNRPRPALSEAKCGWIQAYDWPGNIRELENTIKRLVALGNDGFVLAGADHKIHNGATSPGETEEVYSLKQAARSASREAEKELILKALSRNRWNRKRAAEELRISYKALLYKLKQIGAGKPQ